VAPRGVAYVRPGDDFTIDDRLRPGRNRIVS
jgi:hypothetical protein